MVSNQTNGHILFLIGLVCSPGNLADSVPDGLHGVNVKHRVHILYHYGQTLQPHPRVDILLGQLRVIPVPVIVELGKHIVPDLHETITVTAYLTVRSATSVLFPPVIVDLRTGATGACPMLPEIIAGTVLVPVETGNLLWGHTDFFCPDVKCFLVLTIYGRIEPLRLHADHLCQKLPAPGNGLLFEIVPEGKVPQHLKKSQMSGCLTHILNVTGTDTFLAGSHPASGRNLLSCKIGLQGRHAGVDDQQTVVIVGHQGKALHPQVLLALKKFQIHPSQFIYAVWFHGLFPPDLCHILQYSAL